MSNQIKDLSLSYENSLRFVANPKRLVFFAISLIVFTTFSQINLSKTTFSHSKIDKVIQTGNMATLEKENINTRQHLALNFFPSAGNLSEISGSIFNNLSA